MFNISKLRLLSALLILFFSISCAPLTPNSKKTYNASTDSFAKASSYECNNNCPPGDKSVTLNFQIDATTAGFAKQLFLNTALSKDSPTTFELKPQITFQGKFVLDTGTTLSLKNISGPKESHINALADETIAISNISDLLNPVLGFVHSNSAVDKDTRNFFFELIKDQDYKIIFNHLGLHNMAPSFMPANFSDNQNRLFTIDTEGSIASGKFVFSTKTTLGNDAVYSVKILQDKRLVSSVGKVKKDGVFSLQLASSLKDKGEQEHQLLLLAEPLELYTYLPVIEKKISLANYQPENTVIKIDDININNSAVLLKTEFKIQDDTSEPVVNAKVLLLGESASGKITLQTQTNENGVAFLTASAGKYTFATIAPPGHHTGIYIDPLWEVKENGSNIITLFAKKTFSGEILDHKEKPVEGALVKIKRLGPEGSFKPEPILKDIKIVFDAWSNQEGILCSKYTQNPENSKTDCLRPELAAGRYELALIPPAGSRLPYQIQLIDFPTQNSLKTKFKEATLVQGKVVSPKKQEPVSNAFVKIYSNSPKSHNNKPMMVAKTMTNTSGVFSAYLILE